jgi:hypothetical protein
VDLSEWDERRSFALAPRVSSLEPEPHGLLDREGFLVGAQAMGLVGRRLELAPHQLLVPEVLDAGHEFNAILMPRRSTKSTSLVAWMMGRCFTRDDYLAALIYATTAKKARTRFVQDIAPMLDRTFPDKKGRPFTIQRAAGMERVVFANGSVFAILAPKGDDLRSEAWDLIVVDEAGESEPDQTDELLSAAMPTMDTRPGAQFVAAGTAGRYRKGNLLWDQLEEGRAGEGGILEYSAPDTLTADDTDSWAKVAPILERSHPGVAAGLTTLGTLESRYRKMKRSLFLGEYASIFGDVGGGGSIIGPSVWARAEEPSIFGYPQPPDRFTLAIGVTAGLTYGCIVAAWRETDGKARLLVLEHREGIRWLAPRAAELARKYRTPIVHDNFGSCLVVVEELQQLTPRPRFLPQTTRDITTAAGKLVEGLESGLVLHFGQDELTAAALAARKRTIGPKAWAFGRRDIDDDICTIEAASLALRVYDETPARAKVTILRPTG